MPSIRRKTTKTGRDDYEITVSRGRSQSRLFSRYQDKKITPQDKA